METNISGKIHNKKCSLKTHKDDDALYFCNQCKIYMCNKCQNLHRQLFPDHQKLLLDKNQDEIFTGICTEQEHQIKLSYFCKTHNQLCFAACISKIKNNEYGKHKDCEICTNRGYKKRKNRII